MSTRFSTTTLPSDGQRALRDVVHEALESKDAPTLAAAVAAARIVGDGETTRVVNALVSDWNMHEGLPGALVWSVEKR